jgi:Stf0 sulfotransferase
MLNSFLQSHPDICMHGEVFGRSGPLVFFGLDYERGAPPLEEVMRRIRTRNPVGFLKTFVFAAGRYRAVGLKFKYEELLLPEYAELADHITEDAGIRIIHLRRDNLLERFLSQHVAVNVTKVYNIHADGERPPDPGPLYLPIDDCEADFERTERRQAQFRTRFSSHDSIDITYEELVGSQAQVLHRIQAFLGLDPRPLETIHKRLRTRGLRESIANWDELRAHFAGTRHAKYFDGSMNADGCPT